MQLALYRAERPEVFEDIIGQKQIVRILQNQIKTGTVSQAYLFAGTHGTGKTTTARILAKAVNCIDAENAEAKSIPCGHCENCEAIREGKFVDVIELDAASNNGVDDLRAIIDLVKYPPTIGKYKVYIIDEVHMLTQAAENAFLKTLEEPPEYAIFILATTDPEKVRATIRSRCMQLNFKRVSEDELIAGMQRICEKKGVDVSEEALATIASKADGSVRDALSILEQCLAAGDDRLDKNMVLEYTGSAGEDFYLALTGAVHHGDLGKALLYIDEIIKRGKDAKQILKDWLEHYRNLMVVKYVSKADRIIRASAENISRMKAQAGEIDIKSIERAIRLISEYINIGRYSDRPRIILETVAVRIAGGNDYVEPSEIGSRARVNKTARDSLEQRGQAAGAEFEQTSAATRTVSVERRNVSDEAGKTGAKKSTDSGNAFVEASISAAAEGDSLELQFSAPREQAGDPDDMWDRIVEECTREKPSFEIMVGRYSRAERFERGELLVKVKKNKLGIAENDTKLINDIARKLFGREIVVSLTAGEIDEAKPESRIAAPAVEEVVEEELDTDALMDEIKGNISNLFGVEVEVVDK